MSGGGVAARAKSTLGGAALYAATARRVLAHSGRRELAQRLRGNDDRLVFVVGSPRSGTTFLAGAIGGQPGFVDLSEVTPLKAAIPRLAALPQDAAATGVRRILERVRRLALVRGVRGVEQTPETVFVLAAALEAYPGARAVHVVRDGRDVACSLLERGWLRADRDGGDDAGLSYGARSRFWVEAERREEFETASEATRAAWAWRSYVTAGRAVSERTLEVRYEAMVTDPDHAAREIATHLGVDATELLRRLAAAHDRSIGRFARDLGADQLADVESEAGPLLRELGYAS